MKALVLTEKNAPLSFQEIPLPTPKEDEALLQLKAAAVNHRDVWIAKGLYPGIQFPTVLGSDGAGVLGEKAFIINPNINWGDNQRHQQKSYQILGLPTNGTFAEFVLVKKDRLLPKPAHLTFEQAAALPLAGLTAFRALMVRCQAKPEHRVLITGIGGGVALFACQFAIALGAEVYVTSSSDEKIQRAVEMGAKGGANYTKENWVKALEETGGFDVIIDGAAGDGFQHLVKLAKVGANIAFYGGTRGMITQLHPQSVFWKQLSIFGSTMGSDADFQAMLDFVVKYKIVPIVDSVFSLKNGNAALGKMDSGEQFGKIVLVME